MLDVGGGEQDEMNRPSKFMSLRGERVQSPERGVIVTRPRLVPTPSRHKLLLSAHLFRKDPPTTLTYSI